MTITNNKQKVHCSWVQPLQASICNLVWFLIMGHGNIKLILKWLELMIKCHFLIFFLSKWSQIWCWYGERHETTMFNLELQVEICECLKSCDSNRIMLQLETSVLEGPWLLRINSGSSFTIQHRECFQVQFQIWFGYFKRSKVPSGLGLGSQLWGMDLDPFV